MEKNMEARRLYALGLKGSDCRVYVLGSARSTVQRL